MGKIKVHETEIKKEEWENMENRIKTTHDK